MNVVFETILKYLFKKPLTVRFPYESLETAPRYRGKHEFDIDKCISCGICWRVCPNQAIRMVPAEDRKKYPKLYPEIDLGKCCFCGLCQEFCPTGAIKLTTNYFMSTPNPDVLILKPGKKGEG